MATAAAALTIYDMCKAIDRGMKISEIMLLKKSAEKVALIFGRQSELVEKEGNEKDYLFLRRNMVYLIDYLDYLEKQGERWRRRGSSFSGSS